jgi:AcrR family transcriptional regulator
MPRTPDSFDSGDLLTDAVMALLAESGATGVTLRRLASRRGISVGALTNRWGSRSRMLHVSLNYFRHRWNQVMGMRSWAEGLTGLLPADIAEVEDCLIWFAFCDLARTDPTLAECVAAQREEERQLVQNLLRGRSDEATVDILVALVDGLRLALCSPAPIPVRRAREVLDTQLAALRLRAADLGLSSSPTYLARDA